MDRDDIFWKAAATVAAVVASIGARSVATAAWRATRNEDPPTDIDNPEISWRDAITWAALSGVAVALARVVATRMAARAQQRRHEEERGGVLA